MIDKKIIENIKKVPFLDKKMEMVDKQLQEEKYVESYKVVAALIEIVGMITLEKVFHEEIQDSNIVVLAELFDKHHEKEIKELLISVNGEYNFIKLSEVKEIEVWGLLGNLDDFIHIILEKYGNIFDR